MTRNPPTLAMAVGILLWATTTHAQEPFNSPAATQPSTGQFLIKEQLHYFSLRADPSRFDREIQEIHMLTTINYGLTHNLAATLKVPFHIQYNENGGHETGFGDLTFTLKWRIWQHDSGATDTARLGLIGGLELRSGDAAFSSDSYDPILGAAFTQIIGRHGYNLSAQYHITTDGRSDPLYPGESSADHIKYDASYLYRLAPEAYTADTAGSWYALVEMNGDYETNGDHEILLGPGIMYEAHTWAFELGIQLPAIQELDHRPERRFRLTIGLRWFF